MDIKQAPIDSLLADLSVSEEPDIPAIDKWLETDNIYPGTERKTAKELYELYAAWCDGIIEEKLPKPHWGREMTRRFKKVQINGRAHYMVSRNKVVKVPRKI
jgi:hypothetical protein